METGLLLSINVTHRETHPYRLINTHTHPQHTHAQTNPNEFLIIMFGRSGRGFTHCHVSQTPKVDHLLPRLTAADDPNKHSKTLPLANNGNAAKLELMHCRNQFNSCDKNQIFSSLISILFPKKSFGNVNKFNSNVFITKEM